MSWLATAGESHASPGASRVATVTGDDDDDDDDDGDGGGGSWQRSW